MIRVGTSGWVYGDWRGRFYPRGVPQRDWLRYYAERFDTVELNATTYRLPKEQQVRTWCETVPAGFAYTVKLSRLITHRKTLTPRVDEFIENYMDRVACFETGKAAQILVQFPPYLQRDDDHLRAFLAKLPSHYRYVVEFRHPSWSDARVETILRERAIAYCIHYYPGLRVRNIVTSGELAYLRLHGYEALYAGSYPDQSLRYWVKRIRQLAGQARDIYVYFNNDTRAAAPRDAIRLKNMLSQ